MGRVGTGGAGQPTISSARAARGPDRPGDLRAWSRSAVPEIGDGEALVRIEWISLDPTNRAWISDMPTYLPPVGIGEVMRGIGLGRVVASKHPDYAEGQLVQGLTGWQEWFVASDAAPLLPVAEIEGVSPSAFLGVFGMTGLTAWVGMKEIGKPQPGRDRRRLRRRRRGRLDRRPARQDPRRPGRRHRRRAARSARSSPSASASTRRSTTSAATGASSWPRRRPTGSTSTSRTSAARSWTRSSPVSTCAPVSPSAG